MVKNTDNFIMLLTGELYTDLMEIHMLELRKLPRSSRIWQNRTNISEKPMRN